MKHSNIKEIETLGIDLAKNRMEACSGAHYWAREFTLLGHEVGIMASKFVSPYRTGAKNDLNDAQAICEAVRRPNIGFVPVKTPEQ